MTGKPRKDAGENLPAPATVRENVEALVERSPGAISYDPADEGNFLLHVRMETDPGIPAGQRDGWRGVVKEWCCCARDFEDAQTGEVHTLPTLVLLSAKNEVVVLANWPAISSWAAIVRKAGLEKCRRGIPVVVRRRPSQTAGRSYWSVQVDPSYPLNPEQES